MEARQLRCKDVRIVIMVVHDESCYDFVTDGKWVVQLISKDTDLEEVVQVGQVEYREQVAIVVEALSIAVDIECLCIHCICISYDDT